jgi:hypothetical protein
MRTYRHPPHHRHLFQEKQSIVIDFQSSHEFLHKYILSGRSSWEQFQNLVWTRNHIKMEGISLITSHSSIISTHPKSTTFHVSNPVNTEITPEMQEFWNHLSIHQFPEVPDMEGHSALDTTTVASSYLEPLHMIGNVLWSDCFLLVLGGLFLCFLFSIMYHFL